jgi:hypothetical protein
LDAIMAETAKEEAFLSEINEYQNLIEADY